jgi:hypothetical protein
MTRLDLEGIFQQQYKSILLIATDMLLFYLILILFSNFLATGNWLLTNHLCLSA